MIILSDAVKYTTLFQRKIKHEFFSDKEFFRQESGRNIKCL